ncbi:MAG: 50S ribosomal protein L32 [Alphaproteobacteria bacterium]|nr:50S ribosomal protein L32 [Alphaproteobacteria bacterium]
MATPKKKTSKSKSAMRRSHDALKPNASGKCKKCGELKRPHHVCSACGNYDEKQVVAK